MLNRLGPRIPDMTDDMLETELGVPAKPHLLPVFVHVPKAGGTTMMSIIHNNLKQNGLESGFKFYGNPPYPFQLHAAMDQPRGTLSYIAGHIPYEQLQVVANDLRVQVLPFTILREPRERFLSHFAWSQQYQKGLTLEEFISNTVPNTMFRMLVPADSDRSDIEATLSALKTALSTHFIVGLTERFEESLVLFKRAGLVDNISFNKHKVISSRLRWSDLTQQEQELVDSMIVLDKRVYEIGKQIFEQMIAAQDASFAPEVESFKRIQAEKPFVECEDDQAPYGHFTCDGKFQDRMHALKEVREERQGVKMVGDMLYIPFEAIIPKTRYY